jgi:hypothetical protein
MFGYIIAAVQLKLPHTFVKSIVVSVTDAERREGWKYVDEIPNDRVCEVNDVPMPPSARMPIALHYCQRYFLGEVRFRTSCFVSWHIAFRTSLSLLYLV